MNNAELISKENFETGSHLGIGINQKLVRCKDCKKRYSLECSLEGSSFESHTDTDNFFCANGER